MVTLALLSWLLATIGRMAGTSVNYLLLTLQSPVLADYIKPSLESEGLICRRMSLSLPLQHCGIRTVKFQNIWGIQMG